MRRRDRRPGRSRRAEAADSATTGSGVVCGPVCVRAGVRAAMVSGRAAGAGDTPAPAVPPLRPARSSRGSSPRAPPGRGASRWAGRKHGAGRGGPGPDESPSRRRSPAPATAAPSVLSSAASGAIARLVVRPRRSLGSLVTGSRSPAGRPAAAVACSPWLGSYVSGSDVSWCVSGSCASDRAPTRRVHPAPTDPRGPGPGRRRPRRPREVLSAGTRLPEPPRYAARTRPPSALRSARCPAAEPRVDDAAVDRPRGATRLVGVGPGSGVGAVAAGAFSCPAAVIGNPVGTASPVGAPSFSVAPATSRCPAPAAAGSRPGPDSEGAPGLALGTRVRGCSVAGGSATSRLSGCPLLLGGGLAAQRGAGGAGGESHRGRRPGEPGRWGAASVVRGASGRSGRPARCGGTPFGAPTGASAASPRGDRLLGLSPRTPRGGAGSVTDAVSPPPGPPMGAPPRCTVMPCRAPRRPTTNRPMRREAETSTADGRGRAGGWRRRARRRPCRRRGRRSRRRSSRPARACCS